MMAIKAGIASRAQREAIFTVMLQRQKLYAMPTISGTLLPPYPVGTFQNPSMAAPFFLSKWWTMALVGNSSDSFVGSE